MNTVTLHQMLRLYGREHGIGPTVLVGSLILHGRHPVEHVDGKRLLGHQFLRVALLA